MMPDYGPGAIWRVTGHHGPEANLPVEIEGQLDAWAREWATFHNCDVPDDANEVWTRRGRALHTAAAAHYERFNVLLLADFEGTNEEQVARRREWSARWRDDASGEPM
jgi:hypothetical protein